MPKFGNLMRQQRSRISTPFHSLRIYTISKEEHCAFQSQIFSPATTNFLSNNTTIKRQKTLMGKKKDKKERKETTTITTTIIAYHQSIDIILIIPRDKQPITHFLGRKLYTLGKDKHAQLLTEKPQYSIRSMMQ